MEMSLPRLRLPLIGLVLTLLLGSAGGAHARPFATAEASSLPPSITALSGQMIAGSWVAGSQTISLSADAPTGISHVAVLIDGGTVSDHHYHCDFSQPIPCSNLA